MRKLIIKTAVISFASAVAAVIAFVLIVIFAFPARASEWAIKLGADGAAANLALNAYEKSGSEIDLKNAIDRAIIAEKYEIIAEYGEAFIETEAFENASSENVADGTGISGVGYDSYVIGNLAVAYYRTGDGKDALDIITLYTREYAEFCPARYLVMEVAACKDKDFAAQLLAELKEFSFSGDEAARLSADIELLEGIIEG